MSLRKQLMDVLAREPRSVSSLARELGVPRGEVEDALRHMLQSARAAATASWLCRPAAGRAASPSARTR